MSLPVKYTIGDMVKMKKIHPCGGDIWEIMRTGVDFRIRCNTCGRVVMVPRPKFEKSVKAIVASAPPSEES
jgi:hypothetical protein